MYRLVVLVYAQYAQGGIVMEMDGRIMLRVPDGLLDRIDAVRGGETRSGFIRGAVEVALGVEVRREPERKKISSVPADQIVLLALVRKRVLSSRDAEKALGWLGLRYGNAERGLLKAGLIEVRDGVLVEA